MKTHEDAEKDLRYGDDVSVLLDSGIKMLGHIACEDSENREKYHASVLKCA